MNSRRTTWSHLMGVSVIVLMDDAQSGLVITDNARSGLVIMGMVLCRYISDFIFF